MQGGCARRHGGSQIREPRTPWAPGFSVGAGWGRGDGVDGVAEGAGATVAGAADTVAAGVIAAGVSVAVTDDADGVVLEWQATALISTASTASLDLIGLITTLAAAGFSGP